MFTEIFTVSLQRVYVNIVVNKGFWVERVCNLLGDACHICQLPKNRKTSHLIDLFFINITILD